MKYVVFRQISNSVMIWFTDSSHLFLVLYPGLACLFNSSIFFINCVLFFTKCSVFPTSGLRMLAKNFVVLYVILPILDTVGLNGTLFLWTLGNP